MFMCVLCSTLTKQCSSEGKRKLDTHTQFDLERFPIYSNLKSRFHLGLQVEDCSWVLEVRYWVHEIEFESWFVKNIQRGLEIVYSSNFFVHLHVWSRRPRKPNKFWSSSSCLCSGSASSSFHLRNMSSRTNKKERAVFYF